MSAILYLYKSNLRQVLDTSYIGFRNIDTAICVVASVIWFKDKLLYTRQTDTSDIDTSHVDIITIDVNHVDIQNCCQEY
jgi:hypothetical protein